MSNLQKAIINAKASDEESKRESKIKYQKDKEEHQKIMDKFGELLRLKKIIIGEKKDYIEWLTGYIEKGGYITHYYDYPMGNKIYIARQDCQMVPMFGSSSIMLVVPKEINIIPVPEEPFGGWGHNNIYFIKDFKHIGSFVPAYSDF